MHVINKLIASVALTTTLAAGSAHATTLSGDLTADNAFFAYISTSSSTLGTLLTSGTPANWVTAFNFTSNQLANQTYYLNIEAINQGSLGGFIGTFTLNGPNFQFANGSQTLETNTTNWSGIYNNSNDGPSQPWVQPTGGVESYGANGVWPWYTVSGVDVSALWIWASDAQSTGPCGVCTVDLQTVITYTGVSATPLPAALPLFASGLGALGLLGWRRKRKAQLAT